MLAETILAQRLLVETLYTLIIMFSCGFLFFRIHSLFRLSSHEGLLHFRNTFLYFALAFLSRYVTYLFVGDVSSPFYVLFGVFIGLGGFSLIRSMIWKRFSSYWWLFSYLVAVLVPVVDYLLHSSYLLFFSQIALFTYGVILAWRDYSRNARGVRQLHLIAMVLFLLGWVANFIGAMLQNMFPIIVLYVYIITATIFIMFVFAFVRVRR